MLITKLRLNYFGRFKNREIELKPGINLIYGENEAGKSTIHTFIRGMLFGIERLRGRGSASKEDTYTRYLPWDYPGAYNGSMDIRIGEKDYRLQRSFHANDRNFTMYDLSNGREVKLTEGLISELIPGLTETAFKNTVSIEQLKAQTDTALAEEVRNYITNLSIAKSKEIDVAKAISNLNQQRKQFEAVQNTAGLKELKTQIDRNLEIEERMDQLSVRLQQLLIQEQNIVKQKETAYDSVDQKTVLLMEQLPAVLEQYKSYRELLNKENILKQQSQELVDKIAALEKEQLACAKLKDDMADLNRLQNSIKEQEKDHLELQARLNRLSNEAVRNILISLLPAGIAALLAGSITEFRPAGIIAAILLLSTGVIGFIRLRGDHDKKQKIFKDEFNALKQKEVLIQTEIEHILHKYAVTGMEELLVKQEEAGRITYELEHRKEQQKDLRNRQAELEDSKDVLYDTIMKYIQYFIPEDELTDDAVCNLQKIIADRRLETSGKLSELNREYESCKLNIERIRWEISSLEGNEEELLGNQARYIEMEQEQKKNEVELEAVRLALTTIEELSTDIHDSFGQQLNEAVSEVISKVTGNRYTDLKVDEKLEVKVGLNGGYILLDRLSAGSIDQIYFALRLAVADLLLGKQEVPLLFDDSFAYYDDIRVKEALGMLSQRKQVILFTCHKREQNLLSDMKVPYHFVDIS